LLADLTGEIRYGFIFLLVMLSMPLPLLMFKLDVDQGREDAIAHSAARDRVREETDD
jgi:UMF1 family MFS transporter